MVEEMTGSMDGFSVLWTDALALTGSAIGWQGAAILR